MVIFLHLYMHIAYSCSGNYAFMMQDYNSSLAPLFTTDEEHCYTAEDRTHARDPTKGLDLAIFLVLAWIAALMCIGTLLELFPRASSDAAITTSSKSLTMELVKSFSLVSNTSSLMSTKSGSGRLESMNGIK